MGNYGHGGDIYSRDIKYDFSANINPLGMPENAVSALISGISKLEAYPDTECAELTKAIAFYENVKKEYILCGNGASDLIYRLVYALRPKRALLIAPAFSEYARALESVGCEIEYELLLEKNGFELTDSVLRRIPNADIFFVCSPNNPIGNTVKPELRKKIAEKCTLSGTRLVADECFIDFVCGAEKLTAKNHLSSGVIVLKAFTKIFAMAGLRLGYIICEDPNVIARVKSIGQCWSVSSAAQIAGIAALSQKGYIEETKRFVAKEREYLSESLKKLGFKVFQSETNFIFFSSESNTDIKSLLLSEKIAIRDCENYYGLGNGFFRIAVRTHSENLFLINTLERIMQWQKR